jgi:hypothetical protein
MSNRIEDAKTELAEVDDAHDDENERGGGQPLGMI